MAEQGQGSNVEKTNDEKFAHFARKLGKNAVDAIAIPVFVANITINIAPVIALLPLTASTRSASQYALAAPNAARTSANVDLPSSAPNSALPTIATG